MLQLRARLFHGQASGYVSKPENHPCHWLCSVSLKERAFIFWLVLSPLSSSRSVSGLWMLSGGTLSPILRPRAQSHLLSLFWSLWISWALPGSSAPLLSGRPLPARLLHCGGPFCGWRLWKQNPRRQHLRRTRQPCLRGGSKAAGCFVLFGPSASCHLQMWWNLLAFDAPLTSFTIMGLSLFYSFSALFMGSQEEEEMKVWWAVSVNLNLKQEITREWGWYSAPECLAELKMTHTSI